MVTNRLSYPASWLLQCVHAILCSSFSRVRYLTLRSAFRFEPYEFVAGLFPPNPSYEQTSIFLLSCSAATIAAIVFSKSAPYRKPLYTNGNTLAYALLSK